MVTTIERRVAAMEESAGGGDECPRCGGDDNDGDAYELTFIDPDGPYDREEFCEECGRQLVYVVHWEEDLNSNK